MMYNTRTEQHKAGFKWVNDSIVNETMIVHEILLSELVSRYTGKKAVKKIKRKGNTLVIYYTRKNRSIYSIDYSLMQGLKPVK